LPLAIIDPQRDVTLVDSAGKKIRFVRHVGRELKLNNIHPVHERIEELEKTGDHANITSRAFSSLKDFVQAVRPFAGESTRLLAMKGVFPHKELEELPDWVNVQSVESLTVPYLHAERHLVLMSVSNQDRS
jgi:16S rRNA (guanine527-N7)-methyltransferase